MYHRDISKGLQIFRALLLGRTWNNQNRFQDQLAKRPYPRPKIADGPAHKVSDNYYVYRDARRSICLPQEVKINKMIDGQSSAQTNNSMLPPTPGAVHSIN
ncbi:hypothetical protein SSS_02957 [Sarcoptes scabiei]|uniref:NADH dehydrogenase [ubiquinone] 1 alpha subcomplex subunit 7 n=1 Tax=Sarcoptes scabiei TaxID=52283 RepID=A0A834R1R0_SARSC|nr:hypothetical protein SSS_02957 [Sarcoptes scabiei]UXI14731.1 A-kinase anchor protein 10 [Sarcoptes scabiei]